jgi:hypothetical protein
MFARPKMIGVVRPFADGIYTILPDMACQLVGFIVPEV